MTVDAALAWQAAHRGERTFTFVHLYEPHFPYDPPEPFATEFRGRPYFGEVAAADAALEAAAPDPGAGCQRSHAGRLHRRPRRGLGDHGELTHGIFAYEATLHVPLVMYARAC